MNGPLSILLPVFIASVVGSVHCAGMCGGLVLFAVGSDGTLRRRTRLHLAYHGGRGFAYTALGAAAGLIGAAADIGARLNDGVRTSAVIAGVLMIVIGLGSLAQHAGVLTRVWRPPDAMQKAAQAAHKKAFALPPVPRAATVGLLTPLLPCGWLYAFVVVAAGTGSPVMGAGVLGAFWLGTLPLLGLLGLGLQTLTGPIRERLPAVSALIVVGLGVMTALGRVGIPTVVPDSVGAEPLDERLRRATALTHDDLPCCNPEPPVAEGEGP